MIKEFLNFKYPERKCTDCKLYPCFPGFNKCRSNFSSYGCKSYIERNDDSC